MSDVAPYSDPETTFLREARPLGPITRPAIRPDRLDSGISLPSSPAAPVSFASSELGDSPEPSNTMNQIWTERLFVKWQSWARDKKISTAKREKIIEATRVSLSRNSRLREARRKSLSSCSETSSPASLAPSPDPPMPEYAPFGRKSSISPPDAHFTAQGPIPDPPPRDVPPGTKSPPAVSFDALPPKYASSGIHGPIPAMGEADDFANRPIFHSASSPRDVVPPENAASGAPPSASMMGKIAALDSRPHPDGLPPRRHDDSTLTTLPPHLPDASSPRRHDDLTSTTLPHRPDASSPRRHDDPTLQTLPPRRPDYPPSPPSSIAATDVPPESVDSSDFGPYGYSSHIPPSSVGPYRKTFSCDITALPLEFNAHPLRRTIELLLELEPDLTHQIWRRRTIYVEENFTERQENSSPPNKPHREQREFMNKDLDKESLLKFPGLREADKKILEDAWRTTRPLLLEKIQQALTLGCDWKKILQKLNLAFSDAKSGYPRLKQYVELALDDHVLLKYPLLHADVLIYQLDETYTENNTRNPNRLRWMQTLTREPGEDLLSLAKRVESAYLADNRNPTITKETMYRLPENEYSSSTLYGRFRDCLLNDVDNPARGFYMELKCEEQWTVALQKYSDDQKQIQRMPDLTPEQLRQLDVVVTPPTLTDIAEELMLLPVEKYGNYCPKSGSRLNFFSASHTDPHLIHAEATKERRATIYAEATKKRRAGVYRVPPRESSDDHKWRNSLDNAVREHPSSDVSAVVDDESSGGYRRDGGPRSRMNSRARHNAERAQKYRELQCKPQNPSKPPSYNAEPHNYDASTGADNCKPQNPSKRAYFNADPHINYDVLARGC